MDLKGWRLQLGMESSYRFAFDKALADLKGQDPERVCRNALALRTPEGYEVPFLGEAVRVYLEAGQVLDGAGAPLSVGTAMLVLHHLAWARDVEPEGTWITLKQVPEGGDLFFPAFKKEVMDALVGTYQRDLPAFLSAAKSLGATPLAMGEAGMRFQMFPKVPLAVVLWGADEELPGSANFLFDRTIHHFAPLETLIGFGYYLAQKLVRHPGAPCPTRRLDPFWE